LRTQIVILILVIQTVSGTTMLRNIGLHIVTAILGKLNVEVAAIRVHTVDVVETILNQQEKHVVAVVHMTHLRYAVEAVYTPKQRMTHAVQAVLFCLQSVVVVEVLLEP
jgi:hypothetical protein